MIFNLLIYSLVIFLLQPSNRQPLVAEHVETIAENVNFSLVDALGNIYWIDDAGITRYQPATLKTSNYSNRRNGLISHVDVSDPLNILVFYSRTGIIEFLDRNLAPKELHGNNPRWFESAPPSLAATSAQQGFWAFFPQSMSLKRFDLHFRQQAFNENILQQLPDFSDPVFMVESQNQLFVGTKNKNVYVFDSFTNYLFTIHDIDAEQFQVSGNNLIYFTCNEMRIFNFAKSTETVYLLPEEKVESGFIMGQNLILQTDTAIKRYIIKRSLF